MGLADRDYQREDYHPPRYSTKLIIVLIVAFVIQSIAVFHGSFDSFKWLGLSWDGLKSGYVWQLLTYQFMHGVPAPWHVLFNCLGIFFFGRPMEERLGGRKFLSIYFLAGLIGGILYVLTVPLVFPGRGDIPVVGASAGVCGIMAVFCMLNPM